MRPCVLGSEAVLVICHPREPVLKVTDVRGPACALTETWTCPWTGGVRKRAPLRKARAQSAGLGNATTGLGYKPGVLVTVSLTSPTPLPTSKKTDCHFQKTFILEFV